MLKRIGVVVLWVLATIGTASITLAAVNSVGDHVTQQAAVPIDSEDLLASPAVQALASTTTTTPNAGDSVTTAATPDTSTTTGISTTSTTFATGSTTATTAPSATTTTTTAGGQTVARTLVGGTVIVYHEGNSVTFVSGTAASGFSMEKKGGPDEVVVEFESETHESHYQATVENGELIIEIDESHGD